MEASIDGDSIKIMGVAPLDALYLSLYLSPMGIHLERYDGSIALFKAQYVLDYEGEVGEVMRAVRRALDSVRALDGKLLPAELERMLLMRGWAVRRDGVMIRGVMSVREYSAYAIRIYGEVDDPATLASDVRVDVAVMPLSALSVDVGAYTCITSLLSSMGYKVVNAHMTYAFLEKRTTGNVVSLVRELDSTLRSVEEICRP